MTYGKDERHVASGSFPDRASASEEPVGGCGANASSDEDLAVAAGRGSADAFAELVRRHHATAYRTAYRFLGDAEEARDMAQEAFLHLLRSCARYSPCASFRSYLYRIVSNLCFDYRQKLRPVYLAELPDSPGKGRGPMENVAAAEREKAVRDALANLPERQRIAVILRYFEGMSYSEMALVLDTSEKGIERLLGRGRAALARELGPLLGG